MVIIAILASCIIQQHVLETCVRCCPLLPCYNPTRLHFALIQYGRHDRRLDPRPTLSTPYRPITRQNMVNPTRPFAIVVSVGLARYSVAKTLQLSWSSLPDQNLDTFTPHSHLLHHYQLIVVSSSTLAMSSSQVNHYMPPLAFEP